MHIIILFLGRTKETRRVTRKISVDEDEGFCDSDSNDKAPILPLPSQEDVRKEERKKKTPLRKRVSF